MPFDPPRHPASYHVFTRSEWAALRANAPLELSETDVAALRGLNEPVSVADVIDIYLPLSRLLNLRIAATRNLVSVVESAFLGRPAASVPYIIGIAGSVAVGKSTFARLLQAVLARWPDCPRVDLVATDGFLWPRAKLEQRNLMQRKGFPESYDLRQMLAFLAAVKGNVGPQRVPVYSHEAYDIIPGEFQSVDRPDILIFEGLNVLQPAAHTDAVASDFFDFSIYLDASVEAIASWYVERFLLLQRSVFRRPSSYFHHYRDLSPRQAEQLAQDIWQRINLPNLLQNIRPTRERADLVVCQGDMHLVEELWLRRL